MLPPKISIVRKLLHAFPRHRRNATLRARSSCAETSETHSELGPNCMVDDQIAPIQELSSGRAMWGRALS